MEERLQKIIAMAGLASRRHAEQMILAGEVTVNGKVVDMLGVRADPESDHIKVRGRLINPLLQTREKVHILLNKPKGYLSSVADPDRRPLVTDLMPEALGRLYPVGRLDFNTEGLLILTNDGDLTNFVTAARNNVEKVYEAKVKGLPPEPAIEHSVVKLRRVQIGFLRDDRLPVGKWRMLSPIEVKMLMTKKPRERKSASKPPATSAVKNSSATAARPRSEPNAPRYSNPSSRPDSRAPLKSYTKSPVRSASESASRPSSRPNTRPGLKTSARPGGRPDNKSWGKSGSESSSRPSSGPNRRPGLKSTARPNTRSEEGSFAKKPEKFESESASRPISRPNSRPGSKSFAGPSGRTKSGPGTKRKSSSKTRPAGHGKGRS